MSLQIPGEMLAALKTRPESEWKGFFEELAQQKAMQIEGLETAEELLKLKASVKQIREMQQFFLSEMKRK